MANYAILAIYIAAIPLYYYTDYPFTYRLYASFVCYFVLSIVMFAIFRNTRHFLVTLVVLILHILYAT